MKKILFFIPPLSGGGAEKVLVNLVNNIDKTKFSITVLTLFDVGINRSNLKDDIEYNFIFKNIFRGNIHFLKLFSPQFLFRKMIRDDYNLIVSYLQGPTTRIVSGCNNPNTKIINWVHNEFNNIENLKSSYRNKKELKQCYLKFDGTVCVAQSVKTSFNRVMPEINKNCSVLYNTVDTNYIRERSFEKLENYYFDDNFINLVSVGRFAPQKGFDRLIKIVAKLINEDNLRVRLYLLGDGELLNNYKQLINEEKINDNVIFLGYQENPYKFVKQSDLFVCSSHHEGYSTAVTESLIVETPVVTTLCSGMKELLGENNEYGEVVNNDDLSLYEALRRILSNPNELKSLKDKAIKRSKDFEMDSTISNVEMYFNKILNE